MISYDYYFTVPNYESNRQNVIGFRRKNTI